MTCCTLAKGGRVTSSGGLVVLTPPNVEDDEPPCMAAVPTAAVCCVQCMGLPFQTPTGPRCDSPNYSPLQRYAALHYAFMETNKGKKALRPSTSNKHF